MEILILVLYAVAGYWATGQTIYANKVMYGSYSDILTHRVVVGIVIGYILIPVAIIKKLVCK